MDSSLFDSSDRRKVSSGKRENFGDKEPFLLPNRRKVCTKKKTNQKIDHPDGSISDKNLSSIKSQKQADPTIEYDEY